MLSRISDIRNKQIVCVKNGCVLGYPADVEFSCPDGKAEAVIILGRPRFLGLFGIEPLKMLNTGGAVILGIVYNFLPFMILPLYTSLSKMDNSLVEAAQDLGCNKFYCLRKVIFPLSVPGIASGVTMVFVPCVSTFYITQKLGGGQITLIGDVIEGQFQTAYNYNLGAALSLVLMVMILICLGVLNYFADSDDDGGVLI